MIAAHVREVGVFVRLEREAILLLPFVNLSPLYNHIPVGINQTISLGALHLLGSVIKQQRLAKRIPEPYVGEPSIFKLNKQGHMIIRRVEASFIASDSRR